MVTWTHKDHLGSPVAETNASGTVTWREQYTPYGDTLLKPAANNDKPGFTGHIQDSQTGLTYMQARYYDPVIGRFLSVDPVGFSPAQPFMFNRYAYVANDPLNATDPSGEDALVIISSYKLGEAPLQGAYGHSYVIIVDTETGETVVVSAFPSGDGYPGEKIDVVMDRSFDEVVIEGRVDKYEESVDAGRERVEESVGPSGTATIVEGDYKEIVSKAESYVEEVNSSDIPYKPRTQNSNTFAYSAYEEITGEEAGSDDDLPGSENRLDTQSE